MRNRFSKHTDGQMMIEILAAFVLMTFLLSGLVVAGLFAIKNAQYSRNRSTATKLVSEQLERVRVKRDTEGVGSLAGCSGSCYLQSDLAFNSVPITQGPLTVSLQIVAPNSTECPLPASAVVPTVYKAISRATWDTSREVLVEACFSDWNK